jgi:hypothetical protein
MRWPVPRPSAALLVAILLAPGLARAEALDDCESAYNRGENTGAYFVSTIFARTVRGAQSRLAAHGAVDKLLTVYGNRHGYESEELALCHKHGLWEGVVTRLSVEYSRAGGSDEFACLDRLLVAGHAATLLASVAQLTDLTLLRDDVLAIFAGEPALAGVPWCEALPNEACASVLALDAAAYEPFVEPVAALLCDEVEPPPVDAGVDGGIE